MKGNMKKLVLIFALALSADTAMACGEYVGDIKIAQSLEGKQLRCNYNGVTSPGSLTVKIPRCGPQGKPEVTLEAFEDTYAIQSISPKNKRLEYYLESEKADFGISCMTKEDAGYRLVCDTRKFYQEQEGHSFDKAPEDEKEDVTETVTAFHAFMVDPKKASEDDESGMGPLMYCGLLKAVKPNFSLGCVDLKGKKVTKAQIKKAEDFCAPYLNLESKN